MSYFTIITQSNKIDVVMKMAEFHEIMKRKRTEHDLSQSKLARLVGVDQSTINHIEQGRRNPSFELLLKICDVLEIPLFGEDLPPRTETTISEINDHE